MMPCAFCGRENEPNSRFCIDCGKALKAVVPVAGAGLAGMKVGVLSSSAGRNCPRCGKAVDGSTPFCAHCGARVVDVAEPGACKECGASFVKGVDLFCARCGNRVGDRVSVVTGAAEGGGAAGMGSLALKGVVAGPRISLLSDDRAVMSTYTLDRGEAVIGRGDADIRFERDHFMSPLHARLELREGKLWIRDLGSRNGTWVFVEGACKLTDCDMLLAGSQVLRFRRLGYPGPHPPEADSTRRMGSAVPSVDIACLEQLRADGSVRDVFHLSPGRDISLGRDAGDWLFPYDKTMSGRHLYVKSEDNEFFAQDAGSRNGIAMSARGERALLPGQSFLVGNRVLRLEP